MPKAHEPTKDRRQLVQLHAMVGTPQSVIADILGIDDKTLRLHYRAELDHATAQANAQIGGVLYNKATKGDTAAAIFWLKTRAGWKETERKEHTGPDGGALEVKQTVDLSDNTVDVLKAVASLKIK